jgi:predicted signal transduction protein with EAL and GGDEF domain
LSRLARSANTYARLGGDEFAALLLGCDSVASAVVVAERIHVALQAPLVIDGELVSVTGSIGMAFYPEHGRDSRTLLAHADHAMYRAKRGSHAFAIYAPDQAETRPFLIATHLPEALHRHELVLEYQPKLDLATGELAGIEALVRWRSPLLGVVAPNDFIPLAERSALIRPLTYAILEMALDQALVWRARGWNVPVTRPVATSRRRDRALGRRRQPRIAGQARRGRDRGRNSVSIPARARL